MSGSIATPAVPQATTTAPPVTGANSGITPEAATTPPQMDSKTVRTVRELARDAGAGDAWSPQAREAALEARRAHSGGGGGTLPSNDPDYDSRERMSPEAWHQRVTAAPMRPEGGPSDTENANAQFGKPRDAEPIQEVAPIANKPKGSVPVNKDARPMSVRGLARAAGAR